MELIRLSFGSVDWDDLDRLPDRQVFQTRPWLEFIAKSQGAEPIIAELRDNGTRAGFFTGLIVRKCGLRILGSPFTGWSTDYLGFNLLPGISRASAIQALNHFAFQNLGCIHLELRDRSLRAEDGVELKFQQKPGKTFEVDLSRPEAEIFAAFDNDVRRCVRKSQKDGVTIEEAGDPMFADDYYTQLIDVFRKQGLAPTYGRERVRLLCEMMLPTGHLLLLRARDKSGLCIATGIFPAMNGTMFFWGGASLREYQFLHPNDPLQWHAMRYWKERGMVRYDMGGGGTYKAKYGGTAICVPWLRKSKFAVVEPLRETARRSVRLLQKLRGSVRPRPA